VLVSDRLLAPGSEWRLRREWFERTVLADLLGSDFGLAEIHKLYRCHDPQLEHKQALFDHLTGRWRDLFNARFDLSLYDLTSTNFETEPPFPEGDKRHFGYSRDHRHDCVQVVIRLVVTPEGLPLAYEVLSGDTSDKTQTGPTPRRAISATQQSDRGRPGHAVELLPATRPGGGSLSKPKGRSRHPADPPSGAGAHRGPNLHRLPRLLSARHDRRPSTESLGAGPDPAQPV
jgi:hypothetical protein